jgi:hypothetical protein
VTDTMFLALQIRRAFRAPDGLGKHLIFYHS